MIALVILGVIATFTIPKILMSQQNSKYQAVAREVLSSVSGAFTAYQQDNTLSASTRMSDLTPYLNYVALDTTTTIDYVQTQASRNCGSVVCYKLHNGAMLWFWSAGTPQFGGTATNNAVEFFVDPDGTYSGSATGPGKSEDFYLYYNGRVSSRGYINNPTLVNGASYSPNTTYETDWFSW